MKKALSLLLIAIILCSLTACGNKTARKQNSPNAQGGVSQSQWEDLASRDLFDNVTFTTEATFLRGYDGDRTIVSTIMLDGDRVGFNQDSETEVDLEGGYGARASIYNAILPMLKDYDQYSYNRRENVYEANGPIIYTASVTGIEAKITATNISVVLDDNQRLSTITCDMTQEFVESWPEGDIDVKFVLTVKFTFSNYGTTFVY